MSGIYAPLTVARPFTSVELDSIAGDYLLKSTSATGSIRFQTGTATAATSFVVQDSAASPMLTVNGSGAFNIPAGSSIQHSTGYIIPSWPTGNLDFSGTNGSAIPLTSACTMLSTTAAATRTLAAPTVVGQMKRLIFYNDGGDCVVTVTGLETSQDVITFTDVGQAITLMAVSVGTWIIISYDTGAVGQIFPGLS